MVAPGLPASGLARYAAAADVEILRNAPDLQAARHKRLGVTGAAFHKPGSLEIAPGLKLGVDQPCLVLLRADGGRMSISVSNPANTKLTVAVTVSRRLGGEGVEVVSGGPGRPASRMAFDLPGGMQAGSSVTRTFRIVR